MPDLTTFVFTDLVGSVDLKGRMPGTDAAERDAAYVRLILTPHRERIEAGLAEHGGRVVSTAGDGHFLAFGDTIQAALWAIEVQRSHAEQTDAVGETAAQVRMGLHVGPPQTDPDDSHNYIGRVVDYAARLADYASAEQILASRSAASLLEDAGLADVTLHSHGKRELRGIGEVEVHEVVYSGRQPKAPRTLKGESRDKRTWTVLPATMGLTEYGASLPLSSSASLTAPVKQLGNYELGELIGAGGMGNVYRAKHKLFGRTRAVKIIKPELVAAGGESVVRRFYQEVKATGALEHPNLVVAIDSSSPGDDQHYLVMEYIDGVGLDEVLLAEGQLDIADACEIARQAAFGLEHLYQQGLVHRDVKPSNLMLTLVLDPQGSAFAGNDFDTEAPLRPVAKLMDLGLALLTTGDQQRVTQMNHGGMGTGYYMSPEQWRTTSVDIRADIYSLGCTLYHLLSGEPPFADSDLRPEKAHEREPLPQLHLDEGVPPALAELLNRMMAKRPEDRPQSPLEIARALTPLAEGNQVAELIERCREGAGKLSTATTRRPKPRLDGGSDTLASRRATGTRSLTGSQGSTLAGKVRWLAPSVMLAGALVAATLFAWIANDRREQMLASRRAALGPTAVLTAKLMSGQIQDRFKVLRNLARDPELVENLAKLQADLEDTDAQKAIQQWIVKQKGSADFSSDSWFVNNRQGKQIARAKFLGRTVGEIYAYRDYFHGRDRDLDEAVAAANPPDPIEAPHQSAVYRSSSAKVLKVAFSVPIREQGEVIGVLAMSVVLGKFKALEDARIATQGGIEIVLVDSGSDYVDDPDSEPKHGLVLHHSELEKYTSRKKHYRLPASLLENIETTGGGFLSNYTDLFGRTESPYWGAHAPVIVRIGGEERVTGWVIIAQEPMP